MYYRKRPLWTAAQAPRYTMRARTQQGNTASFVMNLASYNRLASPFASISELRYRELAIKFKDPKDRSKIQAFVRDCQTAPGLTSAQRGKIKFFNYYDDVETL